MEGMALLGECPFTAAGSLEFLVEVELGKPHILSEELPLPLLLSTLAVIPPS